MALVGKADFIFVDKASVPALVGKYSLVAVVIGTAASLAVDVCKAAPDVLVVGKVAVVNAVCH